MKLPDGVVGMKGRGPDWAEWVDHLPRLAEGLLDEWELEQDGWAMHGYTSLVLPVVTALHEPAALKIAFPHEEAEHEHLALSRWAGDGAVRLLRADPHRRAMLLERLQHRTLADVHALEACEVVAGLYHRLHVPALPQLRTLAASLERSAEDLARLPRSAPLPHRLVEQAGSLSLDLAADTGTRARVLHGDLHYTNVLAAEREPWLAIDPKPVSGDPHSELAPMLWNRFDEIEAGPGGVRAGVRRRFHALVDAAGFDEDRARDWVVVRVMLNACAELHDVAAGRTDPDRGWITTCVAIAKAVQE
jgi:streptomycin 6-kinase